MTKRHQTAADQLWKDKLNEGVSAWEAVVLVFLTATVVICGLLFAWV